MFDLKDSLFRFGAIVSFGWLAAALVFLACYGNWGGGLKPNEWGDLFAGVAAPMAFFWLVLGFLQQGKELQLSTKALLLQVEELKNTVKHQADLVQVSREQVAAQVRQEEEQKRARQVANQPGFTLAQASLTGGPEGTRYKMILRNVGAAVTEVRVVFAPGGEFNFPTIGGGEQREFSLQYASAPPSEISGLIHYIDASAAEGAVIFIGHLDATNHMRFKVRPGGVFA